MCTQRIGWSQKLDNDCLSTKVIRSARKETSLSLHKSTGINEMCTVLDGLVDICSICIHHLDMYP
jgi:hypothetical protein